MSKFGGSIFLCAFAAVLFMSPGFVSAGGVTKTPQVKEEKRDIGKTVGKTYDKYIASPLKGIACRKENPHIRRYLCEPLWRGAHKISPEFAKQYRNRPCDLAVFLPIIMVVLVFLYFVLEYIYDKLRNIKK